MVAFGQRVFKDVLGEKKTVIVALIQSDWCPKKRRRFRHRDTAGRRADCKPRRETSVETNPTGTLILNFQPLEL